MSHKDAYLFFKHTSNTAEKKDFLEKIFAETTQVTYFSSFSRLTHFIYVKLWLKAANTSDISVPTLIKTNIIVKEKLQIDMFIVSCNFEVFLNLRRNQFKAALFLIIAFVSVHQRNTISFFKPFNEY